MRFSLDPLLNAALADADWVRGPPAPCVRCKRPTPLVRLGESRCPTCGPPFPENPPFDPLEGFEAARRQALADRCTSEGWREVTMAGTKTFEEAGLPAWPPRCPTCGFSCWWVSPAGALKHPWCAP